MGKQGSREEEKGKDQGGRNIWCVHCRRDDIKWKKKKEKRKKKEERKRKRSGNKKKIKILMERISMIGREIKNEKRWKERK